MPPYPHYPASKEGYKVCPQCKEEKPLTHEYWHKSKARKDGFNGFCRVCQNLNRQIRFSIPENRARKNAQATERVKAQRRTVLQHYGGTPPVCACCGESRLEFLTIDHINGGGRRHRATFSGPLANWLFTNNFPEGFRVLCMNCNHALGQYGYCPHRTKDEIPYGK